MLNRTGKSLLVDWKSFLVSVDAEMQRIVMNPEEYRAALIIIAEAIDPE
jgi:hypothetical protein